MQKCYIHVNKAMSKISSCCHFLYPTLVYVFLQEAVSGEFERKRCLRNKIVHTRLTEVHFPGEITGPVSEMYLQSPTVVAFSLKKSHYRFFPIALMISLAKEIISKGLPIYVHWRPPYGPSPGYTRIAGPRRHISVPAGVG